MAPLILILLAAVLFGKFLYDPGWVLSDFGKDGSTFFYHRWLLAREGFAHGSPTPWNPCSLGGVPALATFQYATLYPPLWVASWLLPLPLAINWLMFSHVCLAGLGMFGWLRFCGLRPAAAALAGVVFMLCGPCFAMRPVAGYVHTMSLAWVPLVFWGIDGWLRQRRWRWVALSASSAALQIYAGYPSLFYFTALMAGVYSLAELFFTEKKLRTAAGLLAIYPVALALAAAQLLPALVHMPESVRTGGVDAAYASTSSLRWENLPLLVSPYLYGGRVWLEEGAGALRWWGNEHPYSCTPFAGLGALLLAAGGLRAGAWRRNLVWPVMAALALAIALGPRTPVFGWLRGLLPVFPGCG
ncbi:MAG: YfhO family protein [Opitutaceae bacterium]|nr:YfhO family protein [Opitutaceae bacterium]